MNMPPKVTFEIIYLNWVLLFPEKSCDYHISGRIALSIHPHTKRIYIQQKAMLAFYMSRKKEGLGLPITSKIDDVANGT